MTHEENNTNVDNDPILSAKETVKELLKKLREGKHPCDDTPESILIRFSMGSIIKACKS